jgi:hypothetical protein
VTSKPRRTTSKTKTKKRKSSGDPSPDEIDIDNTEDEQESDDVETCQDQGFINNSSQDEQQGVHAACDNMRLDTEDAATGRPARDEPEFPSEKKKTRSERRALTALPERGMTESVRKVADYCYKAPHGLPTPNRLVTLYWNQQGHELMNNQLVSGAFGSEQHRTWCNDKRWQVEFASRFLAPWDETFPLRAVTTDIADTLLNPRVCCTNSTAKLLYTIKTSHKQTELDLINCKFIQRAFVGLQQTSSELSLAMHIGPFSCIQGKADVVLWNVRHCDEVSNTSQDILNLIKLIRCAPRDRGLTVTSCGRASARRTPSPTSAASAACSVCRTGHRLCASTTTTRAQRAASRTRSTTCALDAEVFVPLHARRLPRAQTRSVELARYESQALELAFVKDHCEYVVRLHDSEHESLQNAAVAHALAPTKRAHKPQQLLHR